MYRAVMRYLGKEALLEIVKSITTSALLLALALYLFGDKSDGVLPRSFVFNYWLVSLVTIGGLRLFMRQFFLGGWLAAGYRSEERRVGKECRSRWTRYD